MMNLQSTRQCLGKSTPCVPNPDHVELGCEWNRSPLSSLKWNMMPRTQSITPSNNNNNRTCWCLILPFSGTPFWYELKGP